MKTHCKLKTVSNPSTSNHLKTAFNSSYGGDFRKKRKGRKARPLSSKNPHHIVFKINKLYLKNKSFRHPKNFVLVQKLLKKYSKKFAIKIEQISYQHNHIHIQARASRRSHFHNFFRVFTGQIAQNLKVTDTPTGLVRLQGKLRLWEQRPFSRIVIGLRALKILRNYIRLNELEVTGVLPYRSQRLRGISEMDWESLLWPRKRALA